MDNLLGYEYYTNTTDHELSLVVIVYKKVGS